MSAAPPNEERLMEIIRRGEGPDVEFKACRQGLSRAVYESVCAFLNRHGGTILLGVADDGEVSGIAPAMAAQMKKDFVTAINNPQKITPPTYLAVDEVEVAGKTLLRVFVPESSQVHRCNGRIYDRNEDGDLDITDHTVQVAQLYQRKQTTYSENKVFPHLSLSDLDRELIAKCRKVAYLRLEDHPWRNMDDLDLLKSAQLYQADPESGRSGITLAGILLLGKPQPLLQTVPHHRTDLILRKVNLDRYDDRDFVDVNLVESYDRIMQFVHKHLPDTFYLEGTTSISIRDAIFREVASNLLIHREYTNAFPAKLIVEHGRVRTENGSRPHGFGRLDPESFTPFPKNPVIARFFRQIGRADELGSGMRKLMKYCRAYGGADPELVEGDVFRMVIKVPEFGDRAATAADTAHVATQVTPQVTGEVTGEVAGEVAGEVLRLLRACAEDLPRQALQSRVGIKHDEHFRLAYMRPALDAALIEMTIPDKPRSRLQKYRLTAKGRALLAGADKNAENKDR